jgi:hypothetical protein
VNLNAPTGLREGQRETCESDYAATDESKMQLNFFLFLFFESLERSDSEKASSYMSRSGLEALVSGKKQNGFVLN